MVRVRTRGSYRGVPRSVDHGPVTPMVLGPQQGIVAVTDAYDGVGPLMQCPTSVRAATSAGRSPIIVNPVSLQRRSSP